MDIPESDFLSVHTFHRKGSEAQFIALCFEVDISDMPVPYNNEPDKHDDIRFFNVKKLPDNIVTAHKQAIERIRQGDTYSEHGW